MLEIKFYNFCWVQLKFTDRFTPGSSSIKTASNALSKKLRLVAITTGLCLYGRKKLVALQPSVYNKASDFNIQDALI